MAGSIPFDIPPGQPADAALAGSAGPAEERHMDHVVAGLAAAFALDIDLSRAAEQRYDEKWPPGRTLWFVVLCSAALWAMIAAVVMAL